MNLTKKILEARNKIKETSIQKEGTNTYSKYDYFTPSQVSDLVNKVCQDLNIIPVFSLCKDEFGLYGQLDIIDCDETKDSNTLTTYMRTEMPEMKASNLTQQMGSCDTYTKRYMLMSAFCITDNTLDPDSQDNRPQTPVQVPKVDPNVELSIIACTTLDELERYYMGFNTDEKKLYKTLVGKQKLKVS